jgi:hypothetical protein
MLTQRHNSDAFALLLSLDFKFVILFENSTEDSGI